MIPVRGNILTENAMSMLCDLSKKKGVGHVVAELQGLDRSRELMDGESVRSGKNNKDLTMVLSRSKRRRKRRNREKDLKA